LLLWLPGWSALPLSDIDRFLLLAVLVVTPLALSLCERDVIPTARGWVPPLQLLAAVLVVASYAVADRIEAGALSAAWLVFAAGAAAGVRRVVWERTIVARDTPVLCAAVAMIDLLVGAAWLTAARGGLLPLRFGEPLVSLTAIHFHYAGFAVAVLAGVAVSRLRAAAHRSRGVAMVAAGVLAGPPAVAVGFLVSAGARALAVSIFTAAVVGLAVLLLRVAGSEPRRLARTLLATAALAVLFSIFLACAYAWGEWSGAAYLTIPRMVAVHGWVNAFGFTVPALLGLRLARFRPS
jgi:hypothetical protein